MDSSKKKATPPLLPEIGKLYLSKDTIFFGGRWLKRGSFVMVVGIKEDSTPGWDDDDVEIEGWEVSVLVDEFIDMVYIPSRPQSAGHRIVGWFDIFASRMKNEKVKLCFK